MKKLTKKQLSERDNVTQELNERWTLLEEAINSFNESLSRARDFKDEVVSAMEDYVGERSDKWHESDAGSEYSSWKDEWEGVEIEDIEMPDFDPELLMSLPEEVGGF